MDNDYYRILAQSVDILIYDYRNKYELLKSQNLSNEIINKIMNDYQKIRNKEFIDNYKLIKNLLNKN